jgi:hypothetical protein
MTFEKIIKDNRPNISLSSVKTYISNIKSVAKALNTKLDTIEDIIKNSDEIFNYLEGQKLNVRKTKLSAFVVLLDRGKDNDADTSKILVKFRKRITKDGADYEERENKQELTDSQKENYISWDEVLKVYNNLKTEAEPLMKLQRLTLNQFKKLMDYVLLSMYVLIPPRRSLDYADFRIRNIDEKEHNYMTLKNIKRKKVPFLIFNKYKNSTRLGKQEIEIPNTLRNIITSWIKLNPYDYLIVNGKGNKITQSKINDMLNNIFGKRIGSSMLRHIYLTDKYGDVNLQELKQTTHDMGSSDINRTLKYVSKDEASKEK